MLCVVLKYQLLLGMVSLRLPVGAVVLSVAFQGGGLFLWARCPAAEVLREWRIFQVTYTDSAFPLEGDATYVGTAHSAHGIVAHVFETPTTEAPAE